MYVYATHYYPAFGYRQLQLLQCTWDCSSFLDCFHSTPSLELTFKHYKTFFIPGWHQAHSIIDHNHDQSYSGKTGTQERGTTDRYPGHLACSGNTMPLRFVNVNRRCCRQRQQNAATKNRIPCPVSERSGHNSTYLCISPLLH